MARPNRYAQGPRNTPVSRPATSRHPPTHARGSTQVSQRPDLKRWLLPACALALVLLAFVVVQRATGRSEQGPMTGCVVATDPQGSTKAMVEAYKSWLPDEVASCVTSGQAVVDLVLVTSETRTGTTTPISSD